MTPPATQAAPARGLNPMLLVLLGSGCLCMLVLLCVVGLGTLGVGILPALIGAGGALTVQASTPFAIGSRGTAGPPPPVGPTSRFTPAAGTTAPDPSAALGVEVSVPSMGANHVAVGRPHAPYNSTPPTSGPHYDTPAAWGDPHTTVPEETWLHNLEHGGIVALYNCPQGCLGLVQSLDNLLKTGPFSKYGYVKMVVTPYSKIPNKLTLVAWTYYLPLADYDDEAVQKFFEDHQDDGPEDVP